MLNPDHATKAGTIDAVLRRLGTCVSLTVCIAQAQEIEALWTDSGLMGPARLPRLSYEAAPARPHCTEG